SHKDDHLVSNVDIASTVARLAGATPDIPQDGHSLLPLVKDRTANWRENNGLLLEYRTDGRVPSWWAVRTTRYMYDEYPKTGERELYDLSTDPDELTNVAGWAKDRTTRSRLHCKLMRLRGRSC